MNVVGRVGSYLSQSVYSVATPFHPFGGAVDIIVVQQQDGSFRSTPWYVRFGKFQGVLKGAEKVVRIEVNGVEADFHMFLDNSGEAYFIKEIGPGKDDEETSEVNDSNNLDSREDPSGDYSNNVVKKESVSFQRNDSNASSNVGVQLHDDSVESTESDSERRYYDFPDDQSSFDDSLELPEYGSNRYENSDGVGHLAESQSLKSEVVLVTVDGHILTAPITSSEGHSENVQLSTPQFHLGPVDGPDLVEGEATWVADYLSDLSTPKVISKNVCHSKNINIEACGGGGESVLKVQESRSVVNLERELSMRSNAEDSPCSVKKEDIFKSCLELHELAMREDHGGLEVAVDNSQENSPQTRVLTYETERGCPDVGVKDSQENSPQTHLLAHETERGCPDVGVKDSQENSPGALLDLGKTEGGDSQFDIKKSRENSLQTVFIGGEAEQGSCDVEIDHSHENSPQGLLIADESENRGWEVDHAQENSPQTPLVASETEDAGVLVSEISDTFSFSMSENPIGITSPDVQVEPQHTEAQLIENSPRSPATRDECTISTTDEQETPSNDDKKSDERIRIDISLCRNLFRPGMGSSAAAEIFEKHRISEEEFWPSAASIIKNDSLVVRYKDRYWTWDKAAPIVLGMAAYGVDMPVEPDDSIPVETDETPKFTRMPSGRRWRLWPIPFRRVKTLEHATSNSSNEEVFVDPESGTQNQMAETTARSGGGSHSPHKQLVRTNVPTTEQIASLNLKDGQNMVSFIFSTRVLGVQKVEAHIYLWKWNARIVISDVDGTITKSDVLGQFMPLVGKDWTQSGVARLFSAIKENGYQLLFLSARAIVQAYLTRSFLLNLKQDGKALPIGPVVISPDGLFPSLFREVIRRAPHEFKIACLEDIKALFPSDYNPFYAGFGNRDTDELSYRKIGIPKGKIFIINPKGEVAISHRIDVKEKSYTSLHTLVNDMFPPTSMIEQEDYNSWNYWRMPLPDVDL